jgi:hypothetical protein
VDQIRLEFPEFANTDAAVIGYKLADAERMIGPSDAAGLRDDAVKYLACHLVCLSPHGEFARLVESDSPGGATTTYERQYRAILRGTVITAVVL